MLELLTEVNMQINKEQVQQMREWLMDCVWSDVDNDDIECMPDESIIKAVKKHYSGGLESFINDAQG